jgi:hypothetical protein
MRGRSGWAALLLCAVGCGGASQAPSPSGNPGTTASHSLVIHTSGAGDVRSSSPAFDCSAQCSQSLAAGTQVQLTAAATSGFSFSGWQGACSGNGVCALSMDADRDVTATFVALPPPPPGAARVSVNLTGTSAGRVTSSPAGLDCPGTCAFAFPAGTAVTLTAAADASSTFLGFGGACSGNTCTLTATSDQTAYANFNANAPPPPPPPNACAGIAPPDAVAMKQFVHPRESHTFTCLPGAGDLHGTLSFPRNFHDSSAHGTSINFVTVDRTPLQDTYLASESPHPTEQLVGLSSWGDRGHMDPLGGKVVMINNFDSSGTMLGGSNTLLYYNQKIAGAADSREGTLLAGDISTSQAGPFRHAAIMYTSGGTYPVVRWGPQPLASGGDVFGSGVDLLGRALVITDGSATFGAGGISAQWFGPDGTPLTGEFLLIAGFVTGPSTWFETSALIGGGVVVRRMDGYNPTHAHALVTVASGSATAQPAPAWMTSRPDTRLQVARGEHAYAVLPAGAKAVTCSQRLEVLAPDGTSCGAADYPIAAGICDTYDLTLAADGTVIQQLPLSMEDASPYSGGTSCTWRWWPAAVR